MRSTLKKIFKVAIYIFAAIGFIFMLAYLAIILHLTNVQGTNNRLTSEQDSAIKLGSWKTSPEWTALSQAITNDKDAVLKAETASNVSSRLIISELVCEQLRLYTDNRELFKSVFEPLKMLGVQSQYSWGIMGIKQDTAIAIEKNLKDTSSPFYLGKDYEHLLDFKTGDVNSERFNRLTDEKDHYYAYLYTGLYLKEIMNQWQKAGFDISSNPGILSTLYNIGFVHSNPNTSPQIGGADIIVGTTTYTFGGLAESFYNSDELLDLFPR